MQATRGTSLTDDADATPQRPRGVTLVLFSIATAATYAVDQVTKYVAIRDLDPGRPRDLVGSALRLNLTRNPGAAFSVGTGYTAVLTLVAIGVIVFIIRAARRLGSPSWALALGLILGGALGNLTDRLVREPGPFRGHVVDFLELPHWPIFNVADSAICAAAALFVWLTVRGVRIDGSVQR